jgi:hypothetical protein
MRHGVSEGSELVVLLAERRFGLTALGDVHPHADESDDVARHVALRGHDQMQRALGPVGLPDRPVSFVGLS